MNLTPQTLAREAAATGFGVEPLEKVFRLMALLDALNSHPFLKPRIALKGGTRWADLAPGRGHVAEWADHLVTECRERLSILLPLKEAEMEFLRRLNDHGDIAPELLTGDAGLQETIRSHPGLLWKALNVRKHRGLGDGGVVA